jgi:hypothetical protein
MDDHYFSVNLDNDRTLCIAPLTDRSIALSGQEITDPAGYFLFEKKGSDESARVDIIAQVLSEDAALRLREMFKMD